MTKTDISEIFALLKLNFTNAPVFHASSSAEQQANISAMISLWERNTQHVDRWLGLSAAEYIIQHNKFFPSIAEFQEAVSAVSGICAGEISEALSELKMLHAFYLYDLRSEQGVIDALPLRTKRVLDKIGGLSAIYDGERYHTEDFENTYFRMLRTNPHYIPSAEHKTFEIPEQKQISGETADGIIQV